MSKLIKAALVTAAMASSSVFAGSQASDMGNYYFGVGVTQNAVTTTDGSVRSNAGTFTADSTSYQAKNDHNLGYHVLAGYRVNNSWAGEFAWQHNGKVNFENTTNGAITGNFKSDLFDLSAVYSMNLTSSLYGFGKVGVAFYQTKFETSANSSKMNGFGGIYGIGLGTNFTPNMGLRAEWTGFQANDHSAVKAVMPNTVGLTFLYQFA